MSTARFPYMTYARSEGLSAPYCLTQSGMPCPDPSFLGDLRVDLEHPAIEAQPALEARLAGLYGVDPARVLVTPGASAAMALCAQRWFRAGSRVAAELPSYEALRALPPLHGAELVHLERRLDEGWGLSPTRLSRLLSAHEGPGHAFVTNPHNPSGAKQGAAELAALAAVCARSEGVLVSCEAYMEFAPNEERVHAFAVAPNGVSIGTLTKAYGLGALRVGWIVLGEGLAAHGERERLLDESFLLWIDPSTPALRGALRALDQLPTLLAPARRFVVECLPHLESFLERAPGVEALSPALGLSAFARLQGVDDTLAFARWLLAEHGVGVVAGEYFGMRGHVRIGYGLPEATLVEALERLERGLEQWRAGARPSSTKP